MNDIFHEVKQNLLGPLSVGYYFSAFLFSLIGLLIMTYVRSGKRDKNSPATPVHFSWRFLLWDNAKRIVTSLLVLFCLFRFTSEFLNSQLSMKVALAIGFALSLGLDPLINLLASKSDLLCTLLSMPREKYMDKLTQKAQTELSNQQ